jgi:hypothetical protein
MTKREKLCVLCASAVINLLSTRLKAFKFRA